jgi:signal transduction histidine kinase
MEIEEIGFSFAGRSIDYFGSKAITSDITALFELIKNSRDANASKVTLHFKDIRSKNASIEVIDNGDGMSEKEVVEKWMVIGTNSRIQHSKTKRGSPVWGEMGIGRIACQKLSNKTEMVSVKSKRKVRMTFDWSLFENPDITVDQIKFAKEVVDATGEGNGVAIKLKNLKSKWTSKEIHDMKMELSILIAQENFGDIQIIVKSGTEEGEVVGRNYSKLLEEVTKNAPYKIRATFKGGKLSVKALEQATSKRQWESQVVAGNYEETSVGPFEVELFHYPRAPGKQKSAPIEKYYERKIGQEKLESFLQDHFGLYLYRDGAWMKPYGGSTDWLELEAGARQETKKIGLKQVYGTVKMSKRDNPEIKPASHRETLIVNKAFRDLKKIMEEIFRILSECMRNWKEKNQKEELKDMHASTETTQDTFGAMVKNIKKLGRTLPSSEQTTFRTVIDGINEFSNRREQEIEEKVEDLGEMRNYEKNLATLGIATSFMAREVVNPLEENMELVAEGEKMRNKIATRDWKLSKEEQDRTEEMLEQMKSNQGKMLHFMKFVNVLAKHISQSARRSKKPTQVNIQECCETVRDGFIDREEELQIDVIYDWSNKKDSASSENLVVKMDKIDLECIITNLYLNSIESLKTIKNRKRKITIHYQYHNNTLFINFTDNGRGIPKGKLEEVFEPFKFGHSQSSTELHGHGLGLYIVTKIMENYSGTVGAADVSQGAKIQMAFPNIGKVA